MVRSTPKAMALGAMIKAARERVSPRLSQRALEKRLGLGVGQVSRIESGERPPDPELTDTILTALGVTGPDRDRALALAQDDPGADGGGSAWLAVGIPAQRDQLDALLQIEQQSIQITEVSPLVVPGLLQVGSYTRSIMRSGGVPESSIETRVAIRMGRRDVLTRANPVRFTAFVGDQVLRQQFGGPDVMREQLEHLLKMAALPNVDLRFFDLDQHWHAGHAGAFTVLQLTNSKSVIHLEFQASGLFVEQPEQVEAFTSAVEKVTEVSASADQTSALITDALRHIE
ncbi:helix-turn-helix domain-containing protein [Saccharothrix sp. HUAS TT1]|uniref:helix-turn-helix domain-containing protein n=1 Tax=unclassified Saccharothrix TaxID=2593673 RepID=UPI00345B9BBF